jgi:hypothetical protein
MTITSDVQGQITMKGEALISLSALRGLIKTFKYTYDGIEIWKDGRLLSFRSETDDNGTKYKVSANPEGDRLRVTVNGRERVTTGIVVWVTTYWQLPDPKFRGQPMALLDADTGNDVNGTLQYIGLAPVTIAGQPVNCNHYQLTGNVTVDFWYDGSDRLVRQEWVESGHRIVLHLASVKR